MSEQQAAPGGASAPEAPGAPGEPGGARRYPRTFRGLVASMAVLVVALIGYWLVETGLHHGSPAAPTSAPQWRSDVAQIQTVVPIAYPASVPLGWTVTADAWDRTDPRHPLWRIGLVTPQSQFAGIYEQQAPAASVVAATASGGGSRQTGRTTIRTAVGSSWTTWTDAGGDHAYATRTPAGTLVVYGTDDAVVRRLMGLLTTKKLPVRDLNGS